MNLYFYQTVIGKIGIGEIDGKITNVYFETDHELVPPDVITVETVIIKEAARQLKNYFEGGLKEFSLPFEPAGTQFMKNVWQKLCQVPYGKTASYKDIAIGLGNIKAVRAVGQANNKNPIPIFIPCHRIIGANGNLIGYRAGLEIKKKLLDMEAGYGIF